MCLLDLPSHSKFHPKPSTRAAVALPQVATCPGPTSLPGGLSSCTSCPSGVVGPVRASAAASTLPGIVARQYVKSSATSNSMGTNSMPRISPMLSAKYHLQRLALPLVGSFVDEQPKNSLCP